MSVVLPDRPDQASRHTAFWAAVAGRTATVAAVFVGFVLAMLSWSHAQRLLKDPLDSEPFHARQARLKELKDQPASDAVKQQIEHVLVEVRAEDLHLRRVYFQQRRFAAGGAWLLLAGMVVFLAASKTAATLQRKLPTPEPADNLADPDAWRSRVGRWAVAGLGLAVAGIMLALSTGMRPTLPEHWPPSPAATVAQPADTPPAPTAPASTSVTTAPAAPAATTPPAPEEHLKNWPAFRGFTGSGIAAGDAYPTRWDVKSGENLVWKVPVPLPGHSSPVVWNDRLFLTGGSKESRQVFCHDTTTGRLLWQKSVPGKVTGDQMTSEHTGFAAPTPATDGRRVYVSFATNDFAAFDFAGNPVWTRNLGTPKNSLGHAASLRVHGNRLLVQLDQGPAKQGLSRLLALDTATGQNVWEVKRPVPDSWATPIVAEVKGQAQIITCGDPWVIAYDPANGRELWRADCLRQDVGPSPVFANGMVYAAVEYRGAAAVRADGQGDVTKTHIAWSIPEGAPDTTSPLAAGPHVFLLTTYGSLLTCLDAKTGAKRWDKEIDGPFLASPSAVGKYVYLFSEKGKALVLEPGESDAKIVFSTDLGDKITASPAFCAGRLYVRGEKELFCIGTK